MTFKNQTRYNLDKTPSKPTNHTQVWQENKLPKLYQRPKSTHDWRYHFEKIPMKSKYQLMKISSRNKPNPLHFSWWHKVPRRKMFVFQGDKSSGSTTKWIQLMFKNLIGLLPQDVCIIYDFAFEYKMHTHEIITLHTYYSNTSHVQERQEIAIPI